ncbi:MAG: tetratricopeptide repeat protein [Alphaproteobacteria bacterium]|nr:tetratricopeptide repeat protein [Alphaproteobacteria bacterium]
MALRTAEPMTVHAPPLLDQAARAYSAGARDDALALLDQALARLRDTCAPETDPRWGRARALQAELLWQIGQVDRALAIAEAVVSEAGRYGWSDVLPDALRTLGRVCLHQGDLRRAELVLRRALDLAEASGQPTPMVHALRSLGKLANHRRDEHAAAAWYARAAEHARDVTDLRLKVDTLGEFGEVMLRQARFDDAAAVLDQVLHTLQEVDAPQLHARTAMLMGKLCLARNDNAEAARWIRKGKAIFERLGQRNAVANSLNVLGDIARIQGDLDTAEHHYRAAIEGYRAIGAGHEVYSQLNLVLVLVEKGRFAEARSTTEAILAEMEDAGRRGMVAIAHVLLLPALAGLGDGAAFDRHLLDARALLDETHLLDIDLARAALRAAEALDARGDRARAARAAELALDQARASVEGPLHDQIRDLLTAPGGCGRAHPPGPLRPGAGAGLRRHGPGVAGHPRRRRTPRRHQGPHQRARPGSPWSATPSSTRSGRWPPSTTPTSPACWARGRSARRPAPSAGAAWTPAAPTWSWSWPGAAPWPRAAAACPGPTPAS